MDRCRGTLIRRTWRGPAANFNNSSVISRLVAVSVTLTQQGAQRGNLPVTEIISINVFGYIAFTSMANSAVFH